MQLGAVLAQDDMVADVPVVHQTLVVEARNEQPLGSRQSAVVNLNNWCAAMIHLHRLPGARGSSKRI